MPGIVSDFCSCALTNLTKALTATLAGIGLLSSTVWASPHDIELTEEMVEEERVYSPFVGRGYPDQVLFGDTHFHTNLSFDAGLVGTRLTAHEGFRFARGEEVISNTGQRVQLIRPLDFLAITPHAVGFHGYPDTPETREQLRGAIKEGNPVS